MLNFNSELTIIIPIYNEAPFLRRCLDSLVKQTRKAKVILVDDGSTDGSGEICDEYKIYGFEIYHIENQGVSHARNFGIDKTTTRWVTFVDADDELHPRAIENMLKQSAEKHKIVGFNQLRHYDTTNKTKLKYVNRAGVYTMNQLPIQMCMVWNKMYQVDFLNRYKIRFWEDIWYGEDEIFNLECIIRCKTIKCCSTPTIIRHFDNKQSICHLIMEKEILMQQDALQRLLDKTVRPENRKLIAKVLTEHKNSGWDEKIRNKGKVLDESGKLS